MIDFKFIFFLIVFGKFSCYAQQENRSIDVNSEESISNLFEAFKNQYGFSFSFDVELIKEINVKTERNKISIDQLKTIIKKQTKFLLQEVDTSSYILVENPTVIDVCGVVIDNTSTFELIQADIIKSNKTIDVTNEKGIFKLQLKPWDSIAISYLGYKTRKMSVSDFRSGACDTIRLIPEIQSLDKVVIQEYLTTGVQKNEDASINVSTKKLRILPGLVEPDVLQSLQLLPGISSPSEDPAGLHIRGGTPDQNLVLWDGIKMYHNGHLFNQISTFNPFIVKNVTVYRGGTSARYGDRISGAVIIESDDDLFDRVKVGGGANFTHGDLFAKVPISDKVGIMLAGRRSTTDIYQNITYNNLVRKVFQNTRGDIPDINEEVIDENETREDNFSFSDTNFKLIWKPDDKNEVKFSTIFAENRLNNTRNTTGITAISGANLDEVNDIFKIRNAGASFNWVNEYSTNVIQKANVYFSSYDTRYVNTASGVDTASGVNTTFDFSENNIVKDIGAEFSLDIPIAKKHAIGVGYQFVYNEAKYKLKEFFLSEDGVSVDLVESESDINGSGNNHTFYSEYTYTSSKSYINLGIRNSYLSNTDQFFIEPRIFASKEVFKNFRLTTSVELKNQQLNRFQTFGTLLNEVSSLPVADNAWVLSGKIGDDFDFELPVIKSRQFTIGSLYTYKGWNFDLEAYYKKLVDITSVNNFFLGLIDDDNEVDFQTGKEERIGFDLLIKKRIKNYRFWVGYSLSKTLVTFPGIQETSFPGNFDQRHVFNISQTLKLNKLELALGWNYASGVPFTGLIRTIGEEDGVSIDSKGINANRFKDYHRLDASALYRFNLNKKKDWKGMVGLSFRNIYNRKNIISQGLSRDQDVDGNFVRTSQNRSLTFTPDVIMRFNF